MDAKFNGIVWTGSNLLDIQNPSPVSINLRDIARGLSREYRFGGHTRDDLPAYSVCWHSMFCEQIADQMGLPVWARLQALLHDAPEAFLGDMITPVKVLVPAYKAIESRVWAAIAKRFRIPCEFHPEIKRIDQIAMEIEVQNLMTPEGAAAMEIAAPPAEWGAIGAPWMEFTRGRQNESSFAAALFHARASALFDARDIGEIE